jgi:hypothetical protein
VFHGRAVRVNLECPRFPFGAASHRTRRAKSLALGGSVGARTGLGTASHARWYSPAVNLARWVVAALNMGTFPDGLRTLPPRCFEDRVGNQKEPSSLTGRTSVEVGR